MIPKTGVIPPNGYHFIERHNGVERIINGTSYENVAEQLLKYRVSNSLPYGRPFEEVCEYVCSGWPHFCTDHAPASPSPEATKPTFTIEVLQWTQMLWKRQAHIPQPLVSDIEANRRAEICKGCPFQKDWADYGCGTCVDSVRRHSTVFRAGKEVAGAKKPMGCSILGQENHAAVWAAKGSLPDMTPEQKNQLPTQCWRRS